MTRRPRLPHAALLLVLAGLAACGGGAPKQRPDVILIVVDTLRNDRLSAYGYPRPTSPFLEELAAEGALFEDVTCQFSWTMPSMVSLFSGHYLTDFLPVLPPGVPTIAESFQAAGYRTLGVVSNLLVDEKAGFARGFEHYDVSPSRDPVHQGELVPRTIEEIAADLWGPLDERLVESNEERAPFFLYLHTFDPHHPYHDHPDFATELPLEETEAVAPANWQEEALAEAGPPVPEGRADWSDDLAHLHRERGRYDQEVRYTDEQLKVLMASLRERGLLDHAVVALVSDHGEGLWEHIPPRPAEQLRESAPEQFFYQAHGAIQYQEVLETPFLLWGAGVPAGVRTGEPVENVDLFPTLLELADVASRGPLHGRSLVDLMNGRSTPPRPFVYSFAVHGNSVRETATGLKLVIPRGQAEIVGWTDQLFDLSTDPHERRDLAAERPEDVARLRAAYEEWVATYPTPDFFELRRAAAEDAARDETLKALGYTEFETGMGEGEDP